jgi:glyoxylase-like metal-dependent hydrolase (beta-lactamase superfamily II)
VWYLEGTDKKTIVDTGITAERLARRGYKIKPIQPVAEGPRKVGLTPADVEAIILTHLHHYHYSQARVFPNAEVIVQRSELEFAPNPHLMFPGMLASDYRELLIGLRFRIVEGNTAARYGLQRRTNNGPSYTAKTSAHRKKRNKPRCDYQGR